MTLRTFNEEEAFVRPTTTVTILRHHHPERWLKMSTPRPLTLTERSSSQAKVRRVQQVELAGSRTPCAFCVSVSSHSGTKEETRSKAMTKVAAPYKGGRDSRPWTRSDLQLTEGIVMVGAPHRHGGSTQRARLRHSVALHGSRLDLFMNPVKRRLS